MPSDNSQTDEPKPSVMGRIFGSSPKSIAEPEKELRFTRSRQSVLFFIGTAFFGMLCLGSIFCGSLNLGLDDYDFQRTWWIGLLFLIPFYISLRIALRCVRHAYIILTPMGVEIFPFFKPENNLQVIFWQEIDSAEVKDNHLYLHSNAEKTAGTVVTLKPLAPPQVSLLEKAITSRLAK